MNIELPEKVKSLLGQMTEKGFKAYVVGGAVRDLILKREIKDWDLTTDATPEQILQIFPEGFSNNQFGTVGLQTDLGIVEITTMRQEGEYSDARHPDQLSWTKDINEDLKRRDFTINAIALSLDEKMIDPFNGIQDLEDRKIKTVGDADKRFSEDALRLMRAIRFAVTLGFTIDDPTYEAIRLNSSKLANISWERIRDELMKILASDFPYEGMMLLRSSGLLDYILPEIAKCFGIVQEGPKHDRVYDIGEHSFRSLKFCPSLDPIIRFACLIHDVGKLPTYKVDSIGNVTFYGHDVVGGRIAESICKRLKFSKKDSDLVVSLVRYHLFTVDEHQTDAAVRRFIKNIGIENLDNMFALREADRLGGSSNPTSWRTEYFKERTKKVLEKPFSVTDLKVNGKDVMETLGIPPSRKVGEILDKLFEEVSEDQAKNEREYLLKRMADLVA